FAVPSNPCRRWSAPLFRGALLGGAALVVVAVQALLGLPPGHAEPAAGPAKAHETSLSAGQEFFAGSPAAPRCAVHRIQSLTQSEPVPDADVEVRLKAADGKLVPLFHGKTGPQGTVDASFTVPALPAGTYTLQVATRSAGGAETLERNVRV